MIEKLIGEISAIDGLQPVVTGAPDRLAAPLTENVMANLHCHQAFTISEMVVRGSLCAMTLGDVVLWLSSLGTDAHDEIAAELRAAGWRPVRFSVDPMRTRWVPGDATPEELADWADVLHRHLTGADDEGGGTHTVPDSEEANE